MVNKGRFGHFTYGGFEPREAPPPKPPKFDDRGTGRASDSAIYGAGLRLNDHSDDGNDFDLTVDSSRKTLDLSSGVDHFAGDLAVKFTTIGRKLVGKLINNENLADFEMDVRDLLRADDRVERITEVSVEDAADMPDTVVVDASFIATDSTRHTVRQPVATGPRATITFF